MTEPTKNDYWFPAKRNGYGWGWPCKWQGWVVLIGFILFNIQMITLLRPPATDPVVFMTLLTVAPITLITICMWKGEPTSWRRGDKDDNDRDAKS